MPKFEILSLGNQLTVYYGTIFIAILIIAALVYLAIISKNIVFTISILIEMLKAMGYGKEEINEEFFIQCPTCGAMNGSYSIFCEECDTALFEFAELETDRSPDQTKNTQTVAISGDPPEFILGAWSIILEQFQKNPDPNVIPGTVMVAHVIFDKYDSPEVTNLLAAFDALLSAVGEPESIKHKAGDLSMELLNHAMEKILGSKCTSDLFYENGNIGFQSGVVLQDTEKAKELIEEAFKDNGLDGVNHLISYFEPAAEKTVQPAAASEQSTTPPTTIADLDKALNIVVANNPDNPTTVLEAATEVLEGIKNDLSSEAIVLRLKCGYIKTAILNEEGIKIDEENAAETPASETNNSEMDKAIQAFRLELMSLTHNSEENNTALRNRLREMLLQIAEDTSDEADTFREDIAALFNLEAQKQATIIRDADEEPLTATPLNYAGLGAEVGKCDAANSPLNLEDSFEKCAKIREFFQKNWEELDIAQQTCAQALGFKKNTWKSSPKKFKKIRITTFLNLDFGVQEAIDKLDFTMEEWDAFASWSKTL